MAGSIGTRPQAAIVQVNMSKVRGDTGNYLQIIASFGAFAHKIARRRVVGQTT
jgi:hypothetical protein